METHSALGWFLPRSAHRRHSVAGGVEWHGGGAAVDSTAKFWFDPLYVEDPLRPTNNVGRNCFRVFAIQQEFCKAHALCTSHSSGCAAVDPSEYPVLSRLCKALPKEAR